MELLHRDELKKPLPGGDSNDSDFGEDVKVTERHQHHHDSHVDKEIVRHGPKPRDLSPVGHERRLAGEIVGEYALGQEIMGYKKHHMAHIVADALGAIAGLVDTKNYVGGVVRKIGYCTLIKVAPS